MASSTSPILTHKAQKDAFLLLHPSDIVVDDEANYSRSADSEDEKSLDALVQNIKDNGQLSPIVVMLGADRKYHAVAGFRRLTAARRIVEVDDTFRIKATVVAPESDEKRFLLNLSENIARRDLSPLDIARAQERLRKEYKWKGRAIADLFGMSQSYVSELKKLLTLSPDLQRQVHTGKLGVGAAFDLAEMTPEDAATIVSEELGDNATPEGEDAPARKRARNTGASTRISKRIKAEQDGDADGDDASDETPAVARITVGEIRNLAEAIQARGEGETDSLAFKIGKALVDLIDRRSGVKECEEEILDALAWADSAK